MTEKRSPLDSPVARVNLRTALCLAVHAFWCVLRGTHGIWVSVDSEITYKISVHRTLPGAPFWQCRVKSS